MAAMLIEIKSRMLLPRPPRTETRRPIRALSLSVACSVRTDEAWPQPGWMNCRRRSATCRHVQVMVEKTAALRLPDVELKIRVAWANILARAKLNKTHLISAQG